MQARSAPVAVLDRVDTCLAERGLQILDMFSVEAEPPRKCRNRVARNLS